MKNSILQLAIQGKLVEQRPEEGTGEELYQQIQVEKKKLIAEGKIKKEKSLPEITEEEIPFEIPESWKWVRVAEIASLNPKNDLDDNLMVGFVPMQCVSDGYKNRHSFEERKWKDVKKGFTHFADGDIGVAKITPCFQNRKSVVFQGLLNGYGAGTTELSIVRSINSLILQEYFLWFFKSDYFITNGVKSFTGTAGQQRIHKDYLSNCLFPLPPLAEQKRIVAKIEELLPYIDRYEQAWSKLEEFNKRFPGDMQKSILQMAIQGKLVEQRPEEGTGEELYQQIQVEKKKLIAEGKIKKEKPLLEIMEDELPFEIPENWKWVRLGDMISYQNGYAYKSTDMNDLSKGYPVIKSGNLMTLEVIIKPRNDYVEVPNSKMLESKILKGDMLMCLSSQSNNPEPLGKTAIYNFDFPALLNQRVLKIQPVNKNVTRYLYYVINSEYFHYAVSHQGGGSAQANLKLDHVLNMFVPFPPLAEQKRIVAKLEEFLPLCERLK